MKRICRCLTIVLVLFFLPVAGFAFGGGEERPLPEASATALSEDQVYPLRLPIFSPLFSGTPLAKVDGQVILLGEVTPELKSANAEKSRHPGETLTDKFNQVLNRLIAERSESKDSNAVVYADRTIGNDFILTLRVPVFLPDFIFTPVASVNEEPIPLGEFARDLGSMHAEMAGVAGEEDHHNDTPAGLLERLVTVRLVEQEARNIGFGQTPAFQRQVKAFAEKTLLYELLGLQVNDLELDREKADIIYHEISLAAKLRSYRFQKQEDAVEMLQQLESGADFDALIQEQVKNGKAVGGEDEGYVPFKELLPQVASAANKMELGEVSKIYNVEDGFVLFRLEDRKFVEDPEALKVAEKITWDQQVAANTQEYVGTIVEKYATFNEVAKNDFSFADIKEKNPEIQLSEALQRFSDDQRILVTVGTDDPPQTMKVNELAEKLKETYFHGTEIDLNAPEADKRAGQILHDWIFRIGGTIEAKNLGLDQSQRYLLKVEEFERRTLFDNFIQKAIVNDIKLTEEEIRQYYDTHQDQYATPAMVRMKSMAFYDQKKAQEALKKLQNGSDFNWVSANSAGLVQVEDKDLLNFNASILSLTSLPPGLQKEAGTVQAGNSIIYSDPESFHYVIYFEKVYPSEPKPYDQVRSQILKIVFQKHVDNALAHYVEKLKEHYPSVVYFTFDEV